MLNLIKSKSTSLAIKISLISIIINFILFLIKLICGIAISSDAIISDAVHSASDVFSTIIVIFGVIMASKASDKEHPYGHERIESIVSLILSGVLFVIGIGIGYEGFLCIYTKAYPVFRIPPIYAILVSILSIVVKELMFQYTAKAAKKLNSDALMADAWHHRSDSLSSVGCLIGIIGVQIGYPICDSIASIIICMFVIKSAYEIFNESCSKLIDRSCNDKTLNKIIDVTSQQYGVIQIDNVKTRLFGPKLYVDIEISVDPQLSIYDAHNIAERVHNAVENSITDVKHCMVHVNPYHCNVK